MGRDNYIDGWMASRRHFAILRKGHLTIPFANSSIIVSCS